MSNIRNVIFFMSLFMVQKLREMFRLHNFPVRCELAVAEKFLKNVLMWK